MHNKNNYNTTKLLVFLNEIFHLIIPPPPKSKVYEQKNRFHKRIIKNTNGTEENICLS